MNTDLTNKELLEQIHWMGLELERCTKALADDFISRRRITGAQTLHMYICPGERYTIIKHMDELDKIVTVTNTGDKLTTANPTYSQRSSFGRIHYFTADGMFKENSLDVVEESITRTEWPLPKPKRRRIITDNWVLLSSATSAAVYLTDLGFEEISRVHGSRLLRLTSDVIRSLVAGDIARYVHHKKLAIEPAVVAITIL